MTWIVAISRKSKEYNFLSHKEGIKLKDCLFFFIFSPSLNFGVTRKKKKSKSKSWSPNCSDRKIWYYLWKKKTQNIKGCKEESKHGIALLIIMAIKDLIISRNFGGRGTKLLAKCSCIIYTLKWIAFHIRKESVLWLSATTTIRLSSSHTVEAGCHVVAARE